MGPFQRKEALLHKMRQEFPQQSTAQASHAIASQQIGYVQHLRWGFPRWSQPDESSTLAHEHLRKTVSLPRMRQNIRLTKLTANPYAYSYRWVYFGIVKWGEMFHIELEMNNSNNSYSGERPYGCRFCWKAFADGGTLRKHERIHTGKYPFFFHSLFYLPIGLSEKTAIYLIPKK